MLGQAKGQAQYVRINMTRTDVYTYTDADVDTIDIGVSHQAQAFNFIRALDPYHVLVSELRSCHSP
eukprot:SAG31_NODE_3019_length_4784_cov_2.199360_5_plen_66_part_00